MAHLKNRYPIAGYSRTRTQRLIARTVECEPPSILCTESTARQCETPKRRTYPDQASIIGLQPLRPPCAYSILDQLHPRLSSCIRVRDGSLVIIGAPPGRPCRLPCAARITASAGRYTTPGSPRNLKALPLLAPLSLSNGQDRLGCAESRTACPTRHHYVHDPRRVPWHK